MPSAYVNSTLVSFLKFAHWFKASKIVYLNKQGNFLIKKPFANYSKISSEIAAVESELGTFPKSLSISVLECSWSYHNFVGDVDTQLHSNQETLRVFCQKVCIQGITGSTERWCCVICTVHYEYSHVLSGSRTELFVYLLLKENFWLLENWTKFV